MTSGNRVRRVGVCLVFAGIALGTVVALWYSGEPGTQLSTRSADTAPGIPMASAASPMRDGVGGTEVGWSAEDRQAVESNRLPQRQVTFTDAELVRLASDMESWRVGTRVAFDIPHTGTTVESVIERVETGLAGNISYIGRHVGQDAPHRMVVTVGARNAFAYIGSAQGGYEMVGNREYGWLMTSAGMDRHVDYSKPDWYVPGDTRRGDP